MSTDTAINMKNAIALGRDATMKDSKKTGSVSTIVDAIEKEIVQGYLKPKERLIETEISKRFGLSRTPVREAMRVLESRGFVVFSPFKGWNVKELSIDEVRENYVLRAHLTSFATELACQNLTNADLELLERILGEMKLAVQVSDVITYFYRNVRFHDVIQKAAGNGALKKTMELLDKMTLRYRFLSLSLPGRLKESLNEHEKIFKALKKRGTKEAASIAKESALNSGKLLVDSFLGVIPFSES